jgi:hypothetical protein
MVKNVKAGKPARRPPSCESLRADGAACVALRRDGSRFCFAHDPATAAERAASQAMASVNRRAARQARERPLPPR